MEHIPAFCAERQSQERRASGEPFPGLICSPNFMSDQNTQMLGEIAALVADDVPKEICTTSDAVRWLRDQYRALRIAEKWQPIETAPKDGHAILALLPDSDLPHTIRWRVDGWEIAWDQHPLGEFDQPLFWMPCPSRQTGWWCRRCEQRVDMKRKRCGCETSPSPWEPILENRRSEQRLRRQKIMNTKETANGVAVGSADGTHDQQICCSNCGVIIENAEEVIRESSKAWECLECGHDLILSNDQRSESTPK